MKKLIHLALSEARTLEEASSRIITLFQTIKTQGGGSGKIGYVVGIINSDGPKYFKRNRERLNLYTRFLGKLHSFPLFSAIDVFVDPEYKQFQEARLSLLEREKKMYIFWQEILTSGHVTDLFFTPRWELSTGAWDEHKTAKRIGLKIHYVEDSLFYGVK